MVRYGATTAASVRLGSIGSIPAVPAPVEPSNHLTASPVGPRLPGSQDEEPSLDSTAHVTVRHVSKSFGDSQVLRDVNVGFPRGQIGVVIGGSGSGKTTLLKIMGGLDKPNSGSVVVAGVDLVPLSEPALNTVRKRIGMVFQYSALLDWMSVFDNVAFPLREHTQASPEEIRARVEEKLSVLGLVDAAARLPAQLSGGMRKRAALARALILDPEIVMYDEPTSGLDPVMARVVDDLILETRDRFGVTSIVISHDMAAAVRVADRIHLLEGGRIVASGRPGDLLQGTNQHVREFFESSGVDAQRLLVEHQARATSS
jgi:phospholipid/cholesterol/gamma-HCH transport system ATP-binding protein